MQIQNLFRNMDINFYGEIPLKNMNITCTIPSRNPQDKNATND